ncbi:helix-turn-helix domain-containing protein [Saccharibacillus sp. CPCC 101409]|uniref:RodZ domain-containing protein n=1 Tax=Saccharibacillus sp. CPCC 101409 TaxID=3058041 RepID=UPI0026737EFB|nr:RodZ domain-containing protein [Saccharibacillus sp. CPCC 101409]MDO3410638.1 helix-turn-helix domain-containing protein [Saccharibacillus sp. CPCC 101409]
MSDLGQQLKDARTQKGLSLEDVQEMTKIRKRYLEAIEQGDFKVLPGSFYVRAFIKTYAEAVGLDPEVLLESHPKDVPAAEPESVMEPVLTKRSARNAERGGAAGRGEGSKGLSTALMWTFPILILIIVAIVYINSTKGNDTTAGDDQKPDTAATTKPADNAGTAKDNEEPTGTTGGGTQDAGTSDGDEQTPEETDPAASTPGEVTPPDESTNGQDAEETDSGTAAGGETDNGANAEETQPGTPGDGTGAGDAENGETDTEEPGTGQENTTGSTIVTQAGQQGKTTVYQVQPTSGGTAKITIAATGMSWLEVYRGSTSGERLYYQNTEAGENMSFDIDSQGLYIKSGYSPVTAITIDGQPITDGKTTSRFQINLVN